MKYLLEIAAGVAVKNRDEVIRKRAQDHKAEILGEIDRLSEKDVDQIVQQLFPGGVLTGSGFYDLLRDFQHHVGYGDEFYGLVGRVWVKAYSGLSNDEQKVLLDSVFDEKGRGVWRAIHSLPEFCRQVEIEPEFAADWFYRFGKSVKNDMANYNFFNGVAAYATNFPESAFAVLQRYISEELDDLKLHLASLLLGTIRSQAAYGSFDRTAVGAWDRRLRRSHDTKLRLVYDRSLPPSFDGGGITLPTLKRQLTRMLAGPAEEIGEAFNTLWRCLRGKRADEALMKFAVRWFSKNTSGRLPDLAKHYVVDTMWYFTLESGRGKKRIATGVANDLVAAVQPVPAENKGTWDLLEQYLVQRLHEGPAEFEDILGKLTQVNFKGLVAQFRQGRFDHLKSELAKAHVGDLLTKWFISGDAKQREIARIMLDDSEVAVLPKEVVLQADERKLELALWELIRKPPLAEKTSAYLLALEPAFRSASPALQQKLKKEMVLQAINYPGACLAGWKEIEDPSDLLREIITDADKYFEKLRATKDSPAIAFAFPGCKEAAEKEAREFSTRVSRGSREKSVFAKLAKNVQIIYGSTWSIVANGKLGKPSGFHEFGHSMEFARLESIDPEGMAIRRIEAARSIVEAEGGR